MASIRDRMRSAINGGAVVEEYEGDGTEFEMDEAASEDHAQAAEPAPEEPKAGMVRVRIGVNVNAFKRGDEITVESDNKLVMGLVHQGLAEVID